MQEQAIKEKVKERYKKIALEGNSESCCAPSLDCCDSRTVFSVVQMAKNIGYDTKELETVPETSILGVGIMQGNVLLKKYTKNIARFPLYLNQSYLYNYN
jgi:hypothetical protein